MNPNLKTRESKTKVVKRVLMISKVTVINSRPRKRKTRRRKTMRDPAPAITHKIISSSKKSSAENLWLNLLKSKVNYLLP